jgi:integrase/recombinase XerD
MNTLEAAVEEYLRVRRALGFKLHNAGRLLPEFVDFMARQNAQFITTNLVLQWVTLPRDCHPGNWVRRLTAVRCCARFYKGIDPRTEIPPTGVLPRRYQRKARNLPSDADVLNLLRAAKRVRSPKGLWASTHTTLLGLLATTGMRVGEAVALDLEDVDLRARVITIRDAKFGKSRIVPIHPSTVKALRAYARLRDTVVPHPTASSFFVSERGARLTAKFVGKKYLVLARQAGLRATRGRAGPRLHDLRHRFAIRTMLAWYRAGVDVEQRLPILSTYLGHTNSANTYWYMSATPELLGLAVKRLDRTHQEGSL